jgi:hypothetical protein
MYAMTFKCFSCLFAGVSDTCFKYFICLQKYVSNVASVCFKTRLSVAHVAAGTTFRRPQPPAPAVGTPQASGRTCPSRRLGAGTAGKQRLAGLAWALPTMLTCCHISRTWTCMFWSLIRYSFLTRRPVAISSSPIRTSWGLIQASICLRPGRTLQLKHSGCVHFAKSS